MDNPARNSDNMYMFTDASGKFGCEAWCRVQWLQLLWESTIGNWSVAARELVSVACCGAQDGKESR